jgi:hypothetical protein
LVVSGLCVFDIGFPRDSIHISKAYSICLIQVC